MRSYTALIAYMKTSVPCWWRMIAMLFLVLISSAFAQQSFPPSIWPAEQLVSQLLAKAGTPATVALRFENKSQLDATEFRSFRRSVEGEVRRRNLKMVAPEMAIADCKVTLSQNATGLIAIVEIKEGLTRSYAIVPLPARQAPTQRAKTLSLRDSVVWSVGEMILDFAQPNENNVVILTPSRIIYLFREFYGWREGKQQPLKYDRILPRDLRGKVASNGTSTEVYLPGLRCSAQLQDALATCVESDDPWPLDQAGALRAFFSSNRNFYTGVLSGVQGQLPPFFAAAATISNGQPAWVMTGVDGSARLYTDLSRERATFRDWGSDLASIKACGRDVLIVSRPGDLQGSDAVQAVEISDDEASPSTTPIEFPGPVLSLTSNPDAISAVVFNHGTRQYDAHVLKITCE